MRPGIYAQRGNLRSQIKDLKQNIEAKPMGPRQRISAKRNLAALQVDLKALNAEIRQAQTGAKLPEGTN